MVLLLRLSPLIPFSALNYVLSGTSMLPRHYILGCFGMIPGTAAFVYIGASIQTAASMAAGGNVVQTVLFVVGGVATFVAVFLISWFARKQLQKHLNQPTSEDTPAEAALAVEVAASDVPQKVGSSSDSVSTIPTTDDGARK